MKRLLFAIASVVMFLIPVCAGLSALASPASADNIVITWNNNGVYFTCYHTPLPTWRVSYNQESFGQGIMQIDDDTFGPLIEEWDNIYCNSNTPLNLYFIRQLQFVTGNGNWANSTLGATSGWDAMSAWVSAGNNMQISPQNYVVACPPTTGLLVKFRVQYQFQAWAENAPSAYVSSTYVGPTAYLHCHAVSPS